MTLAEKLHHTSRGPKIARVGEEVVHDAHNALRGPKTPPPGVRPGSLAEPGPQRSDRSLRRSLGDTPLLGVPSLADAPAEAIDGRTLRYLLKANLARKKYEEEEEEEKKFQEKAAESRRNSLGSRSLSSKEEEEKEEEEAVAEVFRATSSSFRYSHWGSLRAVRSGSLLFSILVLPGSTVDTVLVSVLRGFGFLPYFLRFGLGS